MATLRKITLNWEIRTGAITCDTGYIKRQELCDVDLYVTVDGTAYALDTSWALNLSIKPALLGDNAALVAVTTWTASATTGLYQATAQTIGGTALDTYLAANNSDTTDDEGNKLVDLDVYYTVSMAMQAKSDTVTVICKPDVGRTDDTVPATIIARNDFLVSNGTGLLVNVAAGYAANGAFVAAQASIAITNATNYIEVTAAGVASVNTTAFTAGSYPLATVVASAGAITSNTDLRAWITPKPGAAGGVTSITGTANEITVTGTTTPTLSLPSALTFTGKTVTGGTFNSGAFNGTVGATTPSTVAGTTGTFSSYIITTGDAAYIAAYGADALIYTDGIRAHIYTSGADANIYTSGANAYIASRSTFKLNDGTYITTLSHAPTADRAIALPNAAGTLALTTDITGGTLAGSFTTLTASSTTSLLLGTAGSAVGNVGFRNATSGTTTLAPATGALGTGTVTLPLSGTLATLEGSNTYTGTTNTFTLPTTTGSTTTSGIAVAANSLTTGTGIYLASSTLTSGKAMDIQVSGTAAAASQTALNVATAGANGTSGITSKGAVISNTHTGTNSTNVALELVCSGAATSNKGLNFTGVGSVANPHISLSSGGNDVREARIYQTTEYRMTVGFANADRFMFDNTHGCASLIDNAYPLGSATYRWNSITVGTGAAVFGGTLAVTGASTLTGLLTTNGGITLGDAQNIAFNTTTGTKIGATTSQKLSFWNATPIVQPTTAVASATVASPGGGVNIKTDDTFDGYTLAQVVKALRNAGLLA